MLENSHTATSLYDLESGEPETETEIRCSIDCEPHFDPAELFAQSIAVSPDSQHIALIRTAEVVDESENLVIQRQTELMVYKLTETGNSWTTRALLKRNLITPEPEKSSCIFGYIFRSHNKLVLFVAFDSEFHCLCPETGLTIFVIDGTGYRDLKITVHQSEDVLAISSVSLLDRCFVFFLMDLIQFYWKADAAKTESGIKIDEFCSIKFQSPGKVCLLKQLEQIPPQSPFVPILKFEFEPAQTELESRELLYLPARSAQSGPPALWRSAVRSVRRARTGWDFTAFKPFCNILPEFPL